MTEFLDTFRGSVNTWECDEVGHMNVQFYVARASDAAFYLRHAHAIWFWGVLEFP